MRRALALLAGLVLAGSAVAEVAPGPVVPEGPPRPGTTLEDPDFGVRTGQFGLERTVEMYQWYRDPNGDFQRVWKAGLVESAGYPPGHRNPAAMPMEGRRWWAEAPTLDGRPLDPSVLRALGRWEAFRPGFSRLPANLAATFQPEGDGLSSADNPLDPRVGDLRLRWRELQLPELAGRVELVDGRWELSPGTANAALNARPLPPVDLPEAEGDRKDPRHWWPLVAGLLILGGGLALWRRRGPRR